MIKKLILLFLWVWLPIRSEEKPLFNHLKPITHSLKESHVPLVDAIYVINLDEKTQKWERMQKVSAEMGIQINRFEAINGWNIPFDTLREICGNYSVHMPKGHYGCLLSHLSVLLDAQKRDLNLIWVMEDDVEFLSSIKQIPALIKEITSLDPDWDLLFTDTNSKNFNGEYLTLEKVNPRPDQPIQEFSYYQQREPISKNLQRIHQRYGLYSVLISKRGIKKILDYFKQHYVWEAIDADIHLIPEFREYAPQHDLVSIYLGDTSSNTRTPVNQTAHDIFVQALELKNANKYNEALEAFITQTTITSNDPEEMFWSFYYIGFLEQLLNKPPEAFCNNYYRAFHLAPHHVEPLYRLALHYRISANYKLGLELAQFALNLPKKANQNSYDPWIQEWGLDMEYSLCAYYLGQNEKAIHTWQKMLQNDTLPQYVRTSVENNLKIEGVSIKKNEEISPVNVYFPEFEKSLNEADINHAKRHSSTKKKSWLQRIKSLIPKSPAWSGSL